MHVSRPPQTFSRYWPLESRLPRHFAACAYAAFRKEKRQAQCDSVLLRSGHQFRPAANDFCIGPFAQHLRTKCLGHTAPRFSGAIFFLHRRPYHHPLRMHAFCTLLAPPNTCIELFRRPLQHVDTLICYLHATAIWDNGFRWCKIRSAQVHCWIRAVCFAFVGSKFLL